MIHFIRLTNDSNGNPRWVTHFLNFTVPTDKGSVQEKYKIALQRSRRFGGKKYSTRIFAGGIVFKTYNIDQLEHEIEMYMTFVADLAKQEV